MNKVLKIFYLFFIMILFAGCSHYSEQPRAVINEIITAYNTGDYESLWIRTLEVDKIALTEDFNNNKDNYEFLTMMLYTLKLNRRPLDEISKGQYLYGLFKMVVGDEKMVFDHFNKKSKNILIAVIKIGSKEYNMPLVYEKEKWFMKVN